MLWGVVGLVGVVLFVRGSHAVNAPVQVIVENRSLRAVAILSGWSYLPPRADTELRVAPRVSPGEQKRGEFFGFHGTVSGCYIVGASRDVRESVRPSYIIETRRLRDCPEDAFVLLDPSAVRRLRQPVRLIVEPDGSVVCVGADRLTYTTPPTTAPPSPTARVRSDG